MSPRELMHLPSRKHRADLSRQARTTATQAVDADIDTRERTAKLIDAIAQPLLPSEDLIPNENLYPVDPDESGRNLGYVIANMDRAEFERLIGLLRTPPEPPGGRAG